MVAFNVGWLGLAPKKWNQQAKRFFTGSPSKYENVPNLLPNQEPLQQQQVNAAMGPGAGGAFGDAADYYRNNLSDNPADFNAFAAPEMRRYNEEIVPGLSEQFAGMGAGGLSSSGFRNAQVQGATDLSERLGALRANLRMNSAQGLQNIGQAGLNPYSQNVMTEQGTEGFLPQAAGAATNAALQYFGVPPVANTYKSMPGQPGAPGTKSIGGKSSWTGQQIPQGMPQQNGLRSSPMIG